MSVERGEYGVALERAGGGYGRSPRKPHDQRHSPARFPRAKIRERPHRESNLLHLGGSRIAARKALITHLNHQPLLKWCNRDLDCTARCDDPRSEDHKRLAGSRIQDNGYSAAAWILGRAALCHTADFVFPGPRGSVQTSPPTTCVSDVRGCDWPRRALRVEYAEGLLCLLQRRRSEEECVTITAISFTTSSRGWLSFTPAKPPAISSERGEKQFPVVNCGNGERTRESLEAGFMSDWLPHVAKGSLLFPIRRAVRWTFSYRALIGERSRSLGDRARGPEKMLRGSPQHPTGVIPEKLLKTEIGMARAGNRTKILPNASPLVDAHSGDSCQATPLVGGFSRGSPVSPCPMIPALLRSHLAYARWLSRPRCKYYLNIRSAVAQWLSRSPPFTAIRIRYPAGSLPEFRMWESCWTMPLAGGFSRGTPASPSLAFLGLHFMSCLGITGAYGFQLESSLMQQPYCYGNEAGMAARCCWVPICYERQGATQPPTRIGALGRGQTMYITGPRGAAEGDPSSSRGDEKLHRGRRRYTTRCILRPSPRAGLCDPRRYNSSVPTGVPTALAWYCPLRRRGGGVEEDSPSNRRHEDSSDCVYNAINNRSGGKKERRQGVKGNNTTSLLFLAQPFMSSAAGVRGWVLKGRRGGLVGVAGEGGRKAGRSLSARVAGTLLQTPRSCVPRREIWSAPSCEDDDAASLRFALASAVQGRARCEQGWATCRRLKSRYRDNLRISKDRANAKVDVASSRFHQLSSPGGDIDYQYTSAT
ncbi:hypothetical protein PR048_032231 [Dryococelus australis]|uniref:Uncharacterized protein n=1 Tax=Dryococelus australis TaxID=614101 RepID=A0ABQ9G2H1_9NEOP|nr:hypothetical protein PR048_032231 [Dryococelus australis]